MERHLASIALLSGAVDFDAILLGEFFANVEIPEKSSRQLHGRGVFFAKESR